MPPPDYSTVYQQKLEEINQFRRELQVEYQGEYERALVEVKEELIEKEGPDLTENMKDEIRDWFNKERLSTTLIYLTKPSPTVCREDQGKFPDYPSDEEGGSALIFNPESVLPCDSDGEGIKKDEKGKKEEKKEGEEEEEKGFRLPPSDFLDGIKTGEKTFNGKYII